VAVITPYNGQVKVVSDTWHRKHPDQKLTVSSVDGFQGREKGPL
jgi:superfamily I DNA and/or RNA helicase